MQHICPQHLSSIHHFGEEHMCAYIDEKRCCRGGCTGAVAGMIARCVSPLEYKRMARFSSFSSAPGSLSVPWYHNTTTSLNSWYQQTTTTPSRQLSTPSYSFPAAYCRSPLALSSVPAVLCHCGKVAKAHSFCVLPSESRAPINICLLHLRRQRSRQPLAPMFALASTRLVHTDVPCLWQQATSPELC